jgi:hypothetical protein
MRSAQEPQSTLPPSPPFRHHGALGSACVPEAFPSCGLYNAGRLARNAITRKQPPLRFARQFGERGGRTCGQVAHGTDRQPLRCVELPLCLAREGKRGESKQSECLCVCVVVVCMLVLFACVFCMPVLVCECCLHVYTCMYIRIHTHIRTHARTHTRIYI